MTANQFFRRASGCRRKGIIGQHNTLTFIQNQKSFRQSVQGFTNARGHHLAGTDMLQDFSQVNREHH